MSNRSSPVQPQQGVRGKPGGSSHSWEEWTQQLQAYVAWVNSQLKKRPGCRLVEDLRRDLQDGVALVHLVEIVSGETLARVDYNPKTTTAMRDNVERVLQFMTTKRIRMHHTSAKDVVDGNLKAIMRLILSLAAHYKPSSVKQAPTTPVSGATTPNISGTPTSVKRGQRTQPSFAAMAANAAAAISDMRKEAAGAGSPMHRHRDYSHRPYTPPSYRIPSYPEHYYYNSHRPYTPLSYRIASYPDHYYYNSRRPKRPPSYRVPGYPEHYCHDSASDSDSSKAPPSAVRGTYDTPSRSMSPRPTRLINSDSDQGSAGEEGSTRQGSKNTWTEILIEDQDVMTANLSETKTLLLQLQELLLSGKFPDEDGSSDAEEDQVLFEGSTPKEQVIVLQSRLVQTQEECSQLRAELSKTKQECRELQGTKAGLQSRLTEQDNALLQMKADILRMGFTTQNLEAECNELKLQLEEREHKSSEATWQLKRKDDLLQQQQDQLEALTEQIQELKLYNSERNANHNENTNHHDDNKRVPESMLRRFNASPSTSKSPVHNKHPPQIGRLPNNDMHNLVHTKVLYFTDSAVTPFMTSIPKKLGEVTLRDFKNIFEKEDGGDYRYHFKALDPEFGTVKEEVVDDEDILPGWEGKIVGWVEEDNG